MGRCHNDLNGVHCFTTLLYDVKGLIVMLVGETEPRSLAKSEMIKGAYK